MLDEYQKIRLRRLRAAGYNYIFACIFVLLIQLTGDSSVPISQWFIIVLVAVCFHTLFYSYTVTGRNLKYKDPSMTEAQILAAAFWGIMVMMLLPQNRIIILMLFLPPFLFGSFKLNRRKYLRLAFIVSLMLGTAILLEHFIFEPKLNLLFEFSVWFSFSAVMVWLSLYGSYVYDTNRKLRLANGYLQKTKSELSEKSKQLEHAANVDYLTGAMNRRAFLEHIRIIDESFDDSEQEQAERFGLLMIDIDHFKKINDKYGHSVGDQVLVVVTHRIKSRLREMDEIARWGGEEFLLLLTKTNEQKTLQIANRIKSLFESSFVNVQGLEIPVTVSIGVASVNSLSNVQDTIVEADKRLYEAKESGRNCVVFTPA